MPLLIQHGYGKSDKVETAIGSASVAGVVAGPRHESPAKMLSFLASLEQLSPPPAYRLFDPQFYASTISPVNEGWLRDYAYFSGPLTRAALTSPVKVASCCADTLQYQASLPLTHFVSPTVHFSDFNDPWSQIALTLATESISAHTAIGAEAPLLLSFAFSESALRNPQALRDYLDILTDLDAAGVYVTVLRNNSQYSANFDSSSLAELLYFLYVLSYINEYELICGYSDLVGLLYLAVGSSAIATGWSGGLRLTSLQNWQPRSGGRAPRVRYTSAPLLNCLFIEPELAAVDAAGLLPSVLSSTSCDSDVLTDRYDRVGSYHQHWEALSGLASELESLPSIRDRCTLMLDKIGKAKALYQQLQSAQVPFDTVTGPRHLESWDSALRTFIQRAKPL